MVPEIPRVSVFGHCPDSVTFPYVYIIQYIISIFRIELDRANSDRANSDRANSDKANYDRANSDRAN